MLARSIKEKIKAKIISNQNCIIGGLSFAKEVFKYSDQKVNFKAKTKDGKKEIPKSICEFVFTLNKKEIKINGTSLLKKPYERLESLSWHKI